MKVLKSNEIPGTRAIFILIGLLILGYVIGNLIGGVVMVAMAVDDFSLAGMASMQEKLMSSKRGWWAMICGQGVGSLFIFTVPAVFYWLLFEKKSFSELNFRSNKLTPTLVALTILATLVALPLISWTAKINEQMQLPAALEGLEKLMKLLEEKASEAVKFLVSFTSIPEYIASMLVIAVVAGVGEELFFRGMLQRKIWYGTGNIHVAIWVSAIVFSAIHFQFYGFLPRMLLGAMFGYLYYWSGNILVPIIAHIFNNGLSITAVFISNRKWADIDMEKTSDVSWPLALVSTFLVGVALYFFYQQFNAKQRTSNWISVLQTKDIYEAELLKNTLESHDIMAVVINRKDSVYPHLGNIDVQVSLGNEAEARSIMSSLSTTE